MQYIISAVIKSRYEVSCLFNKYLRFFWSREYTAFEWFGMTAARDNQPEFRHVAPKASA